MEILFPVYVHPCREIFFLISKGISLGVTGAVPSHSVPKPLKRNLTL